MNENRDPKRTEKSDQKEENPWGLLGLVSGWVLGYTLIGGGIGYFLEKQLGLKTAILSIPLAFIGLGLSFYQIYRYIRRP